MNRPATAALREEHRLILRAVAAFEAMIEAAPTSGPDLDDVASCLTFFRLFTDACHHGKEEDLLFVALEEHGIPAADGPIAAMRAEHRHGRELVRRMTATLKGANNAEAVAHATLRRDAAAYIDLIRAHIDREDGGVFDLADEIVDGAACNTLCASYETVCARRFEGRSLADLERTAETLIARYPGR